MTDIPSIKAETQIEALSESVRILTAELSLDVVLRLIAQIAAKLVNARYAALGIPDGKGGLEQFHPFGMTEDEINRMEHYPRGLGLLGLLIARPEAIRLENIQMDERSIGFPPNHPVMTTFLGVPIMSKGKHLGSLYLCDRHDNKTFSEDDERMIVLLAGHAAIAIENARLSEQLRKLAVIQERDRISMELHDGIIQSIYAVGMKLELIRSSLKNVPEADSQIASATHDLNHVIEDLRSYIQNLNVSVDYSVSLLEQLEEMAEGFRQVSSARLVVDVQRGFAQLTDVRMHTLIQIVREALSNIVRHANASEVYIDIHETSSQITLVISDNGTGFEPDKVKHGSGLQNIHQRVWRLNGSVNVTSRKGRGTTITVILPI
jgi:signal transduction histidine kinase